MNTFGNIYRLTTFGESHGSAIGGVIDGMPAGLKVDLEAVQAELDRRRPGQSEIVTPRSESDTVRILSGIFEGTTTGTPIGFVIENSNTRPADYGNMKEVLRPSHADYTYLAKYGVRDHRGGGRSSARETACRVVGGAFARQALAMSGIRIFAYTESVGPLRVDTLYGPDDAAAAETNPVRCPDPEMAEKMRQLIVGVKKQGDTIGGTVRGVITGCPPGIGEPVFDKLHARLAYAMMGINAAKAFEYGMGFEGCCRTGSEMADNFIAGGNGAITTATNHSGGIQGGISNGADIYFRVGFKPVATLLRDVDTVDIHGNPAILRAKGRHDPCVLPRAVPVVEAMAAMTIFDLMLQSRTSVLHNLC